MRLKQATLLRLRPGDILLIRVKNLTLKRKELIMAAIRPKLDSLKLDPPVIVLVANDDITMSVVRTEAASGQSAIRNPQSAMTTVRNPQSAIA